MVKEINAYSCEACGDLWRTFGEAEDCCYDPENACKADYEAAVKEYETNFQDLLVKYFKNSAPEVKVKHHLWGCNIVFTLECCGDYVQVQDIQVKELKKKSSTQKQQWRLVEALCDFFGEGIEQAAINHPVDTLRLLKESGCDLNEINAVIEEDSKRFEEFYNWSIDCDAKGFIYDYVIEEDVWEPPHLTEYLAYKGV